MMKRRDFLKAIGIGAAALAAPNIVKAKPDVKILGGVENWRIAPNSNEIPEWIEVRRDPYDENLDRLREAAAKISQEDLDQWSRQLRGTGLNKP